MSQTTHTYDIQFRAPGISEAQLKAIIDTIASNNWILQAVQLVG